MDSALPFNLDITNPDGNSFVTWILVTNDGRTQLDGRPHGDALVLNTSLTHEYRDTDQYEMNIFALCIFCIYRWRHFLGF